VLKVRCQGYPPGTRVDVWYRSDTHAAVKVVDDGKSLGGVVEERDLCDPAARAVVSV
jgi:hypothetical protein